MTTAAPDIPRAPEGRLLQWLRKGRIHEAVDELEQRHWLFEAAQELVRRRGPGPAIELLEEGSFPAASLGGLLEASVDALTGKKARSIVWKYLDWPDDYVLATAFRVLSQSSDDPGELSRLLNRAEALAEHQSPLVRIAVLDVLVGRGDVDPTQLILHALNDPEPSVREEALDLADDLASEGRLDSPSRRKILEQGLEDATESVRRLAASRTALAGRL